MILRFLENRVWRAYYGGERLDAFEGKTECVRGRRPEEWIASTVTAFNADRPGEQEGISVCLDGQPFDRVLLENREKLLGGEEAMSILVKLLDAGERLVIQCHPTVPFAKKYWHKPFGKTECWYILSAEEDAHVYLGFREGITREHWKDLFEKQDIPGMLSCLHRHPVKPGNLYFVDGGVPHAIGGGCLMVELQEPSDLMVIPERVTPSGVVLADEKLHGGIGFEKMWDCFSYDGMSQEEIRRKYFRHVLPRENELCNVVDSSLTDRFAMQLLHVTRSTDTDFGGRYAVGVVIEGSGMVSEGGRQLPVRKSDSFFISADTGPLTWQGNDLTVLLCFSHL